MDASTTIQILNSAGVLGLFVILFGLLLTGKLVLGWVYKAAVEREQEYKRMLFEALKVADKGASTAETVVLELRKAAEA